MPNLTWTDDPPTEPGWWWYEHAGIPTLTQVWCLEEGVIARPMNMFSEPVERWHGRWAGPIPEPMEAECSAIS